MYLPTCAGHATREAARTVAQDTIDEKLVALAKAWCESGNGDWEEEAKQHAKMTATTAGMTGLLAMHPELKKYSCLGYLISKLWNESCPEKIISYTYNNPDISWIGDELPIEKTLIIAGNSGYGCGSDAEGTIVLAGHAEDDIGNRGRGIIIATRPAVIHRTFHGTHIAQEQYNQNAPLKAYIDRLIAAATEDPGAAEREFGDGIKITKRINELVGGSR